MTQSDPAPVTITFDPAQGIWHVRSGEEGFWSTGLRRALQHSAATFGVAIDDVVIVVHPTLDLYTVAAQDPDPETADAAASAVVNYVFDHEVPLGIHDLSVLLGCSPDRLTELFDRRSGANSN